MNNNVSVTSIRQGIDYLESQFMNPLVMVGEQLIDEYQELNRVLQSQAINALIREQQNKLDSLKNDLNIIIGTLIKIIKKTRDNLDEE